MWGKKKKKNRIIVQLKNVSRIIDIVNRPMEKNKKKGCRPPGRGWMARDQNDRMFSGVGRVVGDFQKFDATARSRNGKNVWGACPGRTSGEPGPKR